MNDKELGKAVDAAQRALERALLMTLAKNPTAVTVSMFVSKVSVAPSTVELKFTADEVRQAVERQLAALDKPAPPSIQVDKRARGIYHKFNVTRTDGTSGPGKKHHGCFYFVLDLDHDPHAKPALQAYADSCRGDYPRLASDLDDLLVDRPFGSEV